MQRGEKRQAHICIVDDNQMAREVIVEQLATEPYQVTQFPSGIHLLEQLGHIQPDVILMDVMMPQLSGYDVCHTIKQNIAYQHIPIILVTALNSREDMLQGLDAGADEFLSKPVNGAELRARVHTMLRIKQQYDALQSVMQLREDLAQMLIHDMRNPLTTATLYNNFLIKGNKLTLQDNNYATRVQDSLRSLAGFLDEILMVAKMEQGKLILSRSKHNLNQLILDVAKNHSELAQTHSLHLDIDLPAQPHFAYVDAPLLKRVIDNLLSNAFKYALDGNRVTLRLCLPTPHHTTPQQKNPFCIQVLDEGSGIAPENYERIFDKYEVIALKNAGKEQVGLGLAFCKMVVEAHNGRIYASANKPKGTIFTIEM